MQSTRYVTVRLRIEHPEDTDPDDVVTEADYSFTASPNTPDYGGELEEGNNPCKIVDTEIVSISPDFSG